MFCPNYKIKEVKDGFNEIVTALGGQPLTDEEFKSGELRNQRTGLNYQAMEATYKLYHRNGGNMLDIAPNGKHSVLWDTLLNYFNGDRVQAIRAKSNVYSDEFFNWFGDWTAEEKNNVSKVVDENGEPLVVWHGGSMTHVFDTTGRHVSAGIKKGDVGSYFTTSKHSAKSYENIHDYKYGDAVFYILEEMKENGATEEEIEKEWNTSLLGLRSGTRPFYLSIKNAKNTHYSGAKESGYSREDSNVGENDGQIITIEDKAEIEYVVFNPNQIKHVENLGTWNPNDANIYHQQAKIDFSTQQQLSSPSQFFGTSIYETLNSGNLVSSRDILLNILNRNLLSSKDKEIAEILARHDIPVLFEEQPLGQPMSIKAFKDGGFIIVIDPRQLSYLSNEFASTSLLHEVVHALTVGAIKEPKTAEDRAFAEANQKLYSLFNAVFPESEYSREDAINGMYILKDKYEFAAVFMTDPNAKFTLYQKAVELDKAGNNRVLLRLKRFVNALTRLIVNKNVFKNIKQDELKLYEKIAKKYIIGKPTILRGNISNVDIYSSIYNSLNTWDLNTLQAFNSYQSGLRTFTDFVTYAIRTEGESKLSFEDGMALRLHIADLLLIRDAAIASSQLPESDKIHYRDAISGQVAQLHNKNLKTISVLSKFLQETVPQLMEDYKSVANVDTTDNTFYMYQAHDNFGAYKSIFDYIARALLSPSIKEELSEELKDATAIDKLSVVKDINTMANLVAKGSGLALDGINVMFYILMRNMRRDLGKIAEDTHLPTAQLFLNELESIGFDTSKFFEYVGAKDGTKDTTVRALVYLVNKAIREADEVTYNKAVDLLKLEEKLSVGQSVLDLYEVDSEGKTTGYLVRKRNYGKFYNAYRKAIEKINEDFGLPKENRSAPEDYELRKKWNKAKNDWLAKNCDRRYLPEYYEAYNELSELTLNAQESIRSEIHLIKSQPGILGEDGYYHYEKLSSKDWKRLQGLYIERRLLSSDYDINGNKKIEGSDAWKVAKELQALREKLFGDKNKMVKDVEAWQKARQKVIDDAKASGEDVNEVLKKWDARNSTRRLKYDEASEQALVYKQIDEELYELTKGSVEKPVYEVNGDGGAQYEANELRIRDMLNVFKDYNTGEINLAFLPLSVKHKVRLLEVENSKIRKKALAENKELRKQERKYKKARKKLLKKYLVFKVTDQYKATSNDFDDDGTINIDDVQERAPRWATKIIVRDAFDDNGESLLDKYTELIPGDGWVNTDENSSMINKDFDESEGTSMVPKLELYDNSEQYNKITGALKDLYDEVFKTMLESNALLYNRKYHDDYMLPQVTGSIFKYMKKQGQPWLAAWAKVKEEAGVSKQGIRMDTTMGLNIDQIFDDVNELEELITNSDETFGGKSTGRRPDDRLFNIIPQYFTRKLDDPSQLSSDLIGILCEYYNLCNGFKYKSQIKDTCEAMMDMLENRTVTRRTKLGNSEQIRGKQSTTYKIARSFLDMNLYGIKSQSNEKFGVNLDKLGLNFRNYTTANNLGMNPAVAATGFLTASYAHIINGLTGNKGYGMREVFSAGAEVLSHFVKNMGGLNYLGNKTTNDKLMALMEYFNVTDQLDRKFKHSNRNRLARVIFGNWCFGMLTGLDFIIKSNITVSNLMAHRLFEGEFLSKEDIYNRYYNASKEELAEKIKKWNEGVCLYSIFDIKNGKLTIDEKYAEAFARNKFMISERILKSAENADGMATETQKAQITTSFLGAAVLTHRQYFPLLLQDRFGETVYDLDTLLYNQGQFRTIAAIAKFIALGSKDSQKSGFFSNRIDAIKTYLNDNSSREAAGISRARRKHLKKTVLELLAFNLFVSPFISMLANYADDDDNKDDLLLLLITYISRRTEWEIFTPYRVEDALNNFKTVSAQTGTLDNIQALYNATFRQIFPQESLYNTLLGLENKKIGNGSFGGGGSTSRWGESTNTIKRGIYQEKTKQFKAMMKLNPFHNTWEQWYGSKLKRKYYENQIMELNK